jgi:CheY-like chemotaxis protein
VTEQVLARRKLAEADQRKDEFLATLAHELRNPLAPLRNALQLLRLKGVDDTQLGMQEMMERQVNHLVRLVDDLLEISRITRGAFELRKERVNAGLVVRNAVETAQPLIDAGGHQLEVDVRDGLMVDGDPVRLAQIVANLLNNAAKYIGVGGRIAVSGGREGDFAVIRVSDNGPGIAPEAMPRLFEMFNRGERSSQLAQGGLGIGLALSRRLAEMHGGTLEARTSSGGSEFALRLPLASAADQPRAQPAEPGPAAARSVLVVDDNRDAAESLAMLLSHLGATVRVAHDGVSALEEFERRPADVVVLDIGMPGMNGYEVARRMRERFADDAPQLVALTGWGQEDDRRRAREAGFHHHLVKPAELATLQQLLASTARPARTAIPDTSFLEPG